MREGWQARGDTFCLIFRAVLSSERVRPRAEILGIFETKKTPSAALQTAVR